MFTTLTYTLAPRITAGYGDIDSVHKTPHTGIDVAMPIGSNVYAPEGGIVSRIADYGNTSLGKAVFVKTRAGYQYIFGHLSEIRVHEGDRVFGGDILALSGNTGNSTGPHVHIGMVNTAGAFVNPDVNPNLGFMSRIIGNAWTNAHESAQEKARSFVYDFAIGTLNGIRDFVVDMSYSIALIGGGLAIILHVAGWERGTRIAGMLTVGYVLIKYLLG
jgi:murein DD-endopeptidase MepM/ murein hydrolase activator NlpD